MSIAADAADDGVVVAGSGLGAISVYDAELLVFVGATNEPPRFCLEGAGLDCAAAAAASGLRRTSDAAALAALRPSRSGSCRRLCRSGSSVISAFAAASAAAPTAVAAALLRVRSPPPSGIAGAAVTVLGAFFLVPVGVSCVRCGVCGRENRCCAVQTAEERRQLARRLGSSLLLRCFACCSARLLSWRLHKVRLVKLRVPVVLAVVLVLSRLICVRFCLLLLCCACALQSR